MVRLYSINEAQVQAEKFGATVAVCRTVTGIDCSEDPFFVSLDSDESVRARAIVIAAGANYRKLYCGRIGVFRRGRQFTIRPRRLIGADPCTKWLPDSVELDSNGFVWTWLGARWRTA